MRLVLLGLMLWFVAPVGQSQDAQSQISGVLERLQQVQMVAGRFEQARHEKALPQPLRSSGRFLFWRPAGVSWSTEQPLQQTTIYRSDKTLFRDGHTGPPVELKGRAERHFRRVLLDIFTLDDAQLSRDFERQWQFDGQGGWQLLLQARGRAMQRAIDQVALSGAEHIENLQIIFAQGNTLSMRFYDHVAGGEASLGMCERNFAFAPEDCAELLQQAPH